MKQIFVINAADDMIINFVDFNSASSDQKNLRSVAHDMLILKISDENAEFNEFLNDDSKIENAENDDVNNADESDEEKNEKYNENEFLDIINELKI